MAGYYSMNVRFLFDQLNTEPLETHLRKKAIVCGFKYSEPHKHIYEVGVIEM